MRWVVSVFYPGSHKELGRTDGMMGGGQNAEITERYPIAGATVLEAEPGDVLFFSYFTLHRLNAEPL